MGDLGLADHKSVIERLASQCACIDLARVGIMGTSAGGDAAARAMFAYPNFFKAGISASGSYDYCMAMAAWGERYQGLLEPRTDDADNKDFDLIVVPNQGHWPQENLNYLRREWDFLVEHLASEEPAVNYHIAAKPLDDDTEAP